MKRVNTVNWGIFIFAFSFFFLLTTVVQAGPVGPDPRFTVNINTSELFNSGTFEDTLSTGSGTSATIQLAEGTGPGGTKYEIPISIQNMNAITYTDFQIHFKLNTAALINAGKMRNDCGDIRFLDSDKVTAIDNYWIDVCNSSISTVWVKVPSIPASQTKSIYLYYGNNTLTSLSDGDSVFLFFDDFNDNVIDTDKWSVNAIEGMNFFEEGGELKLSGTKTLTDWNMATMTANVAIPSPFNMISNSRIVSSGNQAYRGGMINYSAPAHLYYYGNEANDHDLYGRFDWASWGDGRIFDQVPYNTNYELWIASTLDNNYYAVNNVYMGNKPSTNTSNQVGFYYSINGAGGTVDMRFDNFIVFQHSNAPTEPNYVVGSENVVVHTSGQWESSVEDGDATDLIWNGGWGDGTYSDSVAFTANMSGIANGNNVAFYVKTSETIGELAGADYSLLGTVNTDGNFILRKSDFDNAGVLPLRFIGVKAVFSRPQTTSVTPVLHSYSITYRGDIAAPSVPIILSVASPINIHQPTWTWNSSEDDESGLKDPAYTIQYSLDATFNIPGFIENTNVESFVPSNSLSENRWYVRIRATDLFGNSSAWTSTRLVIVDMTAPVTTVNTDANWHNSAVTLNFSCSDVLTSCAHTYYTLDGSEPTDISTEGTSVVIDKDGVYTVKYYSVDSAGNTEDVETSANEVKIDSTKPSAPNNLSTTSTPNNNNPAWNWDASEDETSGLANPAYTIEWSLSGNFEPGLTTSTATTNINSYTLDVNLPDGTWSFRVKAIDIAGNYSEYSSVVEFVVDKTAPVLSIVGSILTPDNDPTPEFIFSSNELGFISYGGSCFGDINSTILGNNSVVFYPLEDGSYSDCTITVTDSVGNASIPLSIPTFVIDTVTPSTSISNLHLKKVSGDVDVASEAWINAAPVRFEWTPVNDNAGGSGIKGYCVNISDTQGALPESSKGLLGTSQVDIANTPCGFIAPATVTNGVATLDLSDTVTHGDPWLTSQSELYYANIKPIDNAGNIMIGLPVSFSFRYDDTPPTNVKYISAPGGNFVNVGDMNFTWPVGNPLSSSDADSGLLGYQYQINSISDGGWKGVDGQPADTYLGIAYIPAADSIYNLTVNQDGASVNLGDNTVYFRTVDQAGNFSSSGSYRTANLAYGGEAPAFEPGAEVTINPNVSTENNFSISWPVATSASGNAIAGYYYMVNTNPPSNLTTLEGNMTTYVPAGTATSVSDIVLRNVNKGTNTVTVVTVDDHGNYSPSNRITGSFTLNSTNPDPVVGLFVADASIKEASLWRASLAWLPPVYKGTGTLTYIIQRSENGSTWTEVSRTTGMSYIDTVASSKEYFWRVGTIDTSDTSMANPSFTNGVSIIPKGKFSSAANLASGPTVSDVSTKKATISWVTERSSDSRVIYGLESGKYFDVEAAMSNQTTSHSLGLINLKPSTSYFYKALWTDEDGNVGESEERLFQTAPLPIVTNLKESELGLFSVLVSFSVKGAKSAVIDYGKTTGYGSQVVVNTSVDESAYTVRLSNLDDGTQYHYKISLQDIEGDWNSTQIDRVFTTLPRPRVTNIRIQQVKNTASSTVQISWNTNVETTSIISYNKDGNSGQSSEAVDTKFITGEHKMLVSGLNQESLYSLQIKARDHMGNEAVSDLQRFTTAVDTRPPSITNLSAEGESNNVVGSDGQSTVQLVVSWSTDEPASTQVEFGEGTGTTYSNKTFEDSTLTGEHIVILPNLEPSKVYHLRVISKDRAGNETVSYDVVSVTPKAGQNALDLIFGSLKSVFNM